MRRCAKVAIGALILAFPAALAPATPAASPRPIALEADAAKRPLGIDVRHPRLGWRHLPAAGRQRAYRVLVATSRRRLAPGRADAWDSGRVSSPAPWADYRGAALRPHTRYFWTVRTWDREGRASRFARPSWFETAFYDPAAWRARWIAGPERAAVGGLDGIVDDLAQLASGEFCRPVGLGGAVALLGEEARDDYLAGLEGACRAPRPAPLLRRDFAVPAAVERARLYVSGLGYADVHLNGRRLGGDAVLDPGYTDYQRTVLYRTYDVTRALRRGPNAIGVELGSGFYDHAVPSEWNWTHADWRADPRLLLELRVELADGRTLTVGSDGSWRAAEGPTRYDNINVGETFDARREQRGWSTPGFDDSGWLPARPVGAPAGELRAQAHEPIEILSEREPVAVTHPLPGVTVYDFGSQMSGWAELELDSPRGTAAQVSYAEALLPSGTVDYIHNLHIADRIQTDFLVSAGEPVRWRPRFSYKGFRYVQVSGPADLPLAGSVRAVKAQEVRSAVRPTLRFRTDDALLNEIHEVVRRSIANNLHGIVTDTPMYEKNGWTGDAQLTAPTAASLFDMRRFYAKWLRDIRDSQLGSGEIPVIVPAGGRYGYTGVGWDSAWGATPAWDAAMFLIPWEVYERYGDERVLQATYGAMRRYMDAWIPEWSKGGIVRSPLGDHLSPASIDGIGLVTGGSGLNEIVPTAYYAEFARSLSRLARMLGHARAARRYARLRAEVRDAFNARFLDPAAGIYRESADRRFFQTANVVALAFDLVPPDVRERVVAALARDVEANGGNLDTGIVGTRYILGELTRAGLADLAFGIATQRDEPSWGHWISLGYTALPENWGESIRSQDHHMFGSIGRWLYEDLGGVEPLRPGYERIEFRPEVPSGGVDLVELAYRSVRGRVASAWRRTARGLRLRITVPADATGIVMVPAGPAQRVRATSRRGLVRLGRRDGHVRFRALPGKHRFVVSAAR